MNISRREFALLQKLLENAGRVLSREHLTSTLYGWGDDVDSNALEVHIHNLRKKFGAKLIRTIRGVGYMVDKEK
jgi:two-component system response regulator QseB